MAPAMKGAVQGAATTTARAPVSSEPIRPAPPAWEAAFCSDRPASNRPDRFSPISSMTRARVATTPGDCSWKPQPTAAPADLAAISTAAKPTKVSSTPARKARPWARERLASPACEASPRAFIDRIGKTQGIRFSTTPPRKAAPAARARPAIPSPPPKPAPVVATSPSPPAAVGRAPAWAWTPKEWPSTWSRPSRVSGAGPVLKA